MADPVGALQKAVVAALKAEAGVAALVGVRVYDRVPAAPAMPFLSFGPFQALPDAADCIDGVAVNVQISAWSERPGAPEAHALAAAVRACLHEAALDLGPALALVEMRWESTQTLREPDGLTTQSILQFRALIEPA